MPFPKPLPRKVEKRKDLVTRDTRVDRAKTTIRQRHEYRCCVCGRWTMVVHENHFRSLGGTVSLENSFLACDFPHGDCHPLLQQHWITPFVLGSESREPRDFDATKDIGFEMSAGIAERIFGDRPLPPHIVIV
jgi:hypothetical protein